MFLIVLRHHNGRQSETQAIGPFSSTDTLTAFTRGFRLANGPHSSLGMSVLRPLDIPTIHPDELFPWFSDQIGEYRARTVS